MHFLNVQNIYKNSWNVLCLDVSRSLNKFCDLKRKTNLYVFFPFIVYPMRWTKMSSFIIYRLYSPCKNGAYDRRLRSQGILLLFRMTNFWGDFLYVSVLKHVYCEWGRQINWMNTRLWMKAHFPSKNIHRRKIFTL